MFSRFVVHGLTTGEQYIFRVKAVNAVGTSENSQESDVIKVQAIKLLAAQNLFTRITFMYTFIFYFSPL